jgi:transcriptional regulator with XRE-family HTH domain
VKRQELVKKVRSNFEMNQTQFGDMMGVTPTMVSKWENGVNNFEDAHVFELYYMYEENHSKHAEYLFKPFIDQIIFKRSGASKESRIKGTKLTLELCNE